MKIFEETFYPKLKRILSPLSFFDFLFVWSHFFFGSFDEGSAARFLVCLFFGALNCLYLVREGAYHKIEQNIYNCS